MTSNRVVYQWTDEYGDQGFGLFDANRTDELVRDAEEKDIAIHFLRPNERPTVAEIEARDAAELAANEAWWAEQPAAQS